MGHDLRTTFTAGPPIDETGYISSKSCLCFWDYLFGRFSYALRYL
jgi:hypothetical protein